MVDICLTKNLCLWFAAMGLGDGTEACGAHSEVELLESQKEGGKTLIGNRKVCSRWTQ